MENKDESAVSVKTIKLISQNKATIIWGKDSKQFPHHPESNKAKLPYRLWAVPLDITVFFIAALSKTYNIKNWKVKIELSLEGVSHFFNPMLHI